MNDNFHWASSQKQKIVAYSSCESKLYAAQSNLYCSMVDKHGRGIRKNLRKGIVLYQASQSANRLEEQGYGNFGRTKHIKKYYQISQIVKNGTLITKYR
jgi:hypothetical protein